MAKTLEQSGKKVNVAEIVRHGEAITIPEKMNIHEAIEVMQARAEYEEQETVVRRTFEAFPQDGANALNEVLSQKFGWANAVPTPGFFGSNPPQMLSVEVAPGVTKQVPWGRFSVPTLGDRSAFVVCDIDRVRGRIVFSMAAKVLRRDLALVEDLFDEVAKYLKEHSIYRGKAVKIRFTDDDGDLLSMPEPEFLDTSKIDPDSLIYAADVENSVKVNLFTPIVHAQRCLDAGISVKRGIILGGTYGTGKTMAATVASRLAVDAGITYVYVPRANELHHAINFAKQYQSPACVIFCEDIDREVNGERTMEMDDILNILDGIDTKGANIITVVTTNDLESINPAMIRPGRLDAVIDVTPPDADAAARLVRLYAGDLIAPETDLTQVGESLQGIIPAMIAEVVKRAKLVQISTGVTGLLSSDDVLAAAKTLEKQNDLLTRLSQKKEPEPTIDALLGNLVDKRLVSLQEETKRIKSDTEEILENV